MSNSTYTPGKKYIALLFFHFKKLITSCFRGTDKILVTPIRKYNTEAFTEISAK